MSRPESVSSRTANRGWNMCIWRISRRFFSPPEKPSFTDRVMNESSTPRSFIFSASSFLNCGIGMSCFSISPVPSALGDARRALIAVRRKFATETPGIAEGYWNARNTPARARASTGSFKRSTPSSSTRPRSTLYLGCPMIASESVLLPEPFGPMIACTEPLSTTRSIPFRIVLPSTLTTRSLISRLDTHALPRRGRRELGEGHAVQGLRDALLQLEPDGARSAVGFPDAVHDGLALCGTDLRLDRSFQRAHHIAGSDLARLARERVATSRATLAVHEPGAAQHGDQLLEISLRQVLALGHGVQGDGSRAPVLCEVDHEAHPVFAARRDVERRRGISDHFTRNCTRSIPLREGLARRLSSVSRLVILLVFLGSIACTGPTYFGHAPGEDWGVSLHDSDPVFPAWIDVGTGATVRWTDYGSAPQI